MSVAPRTPSSKDERLRKVAMAHCPLMVPYGAMRLTGLDANSDDVIASRTVSKILPCKRSRALAADCCRPDGNADKPNEMHALMPDYGTTPSRAQAGK